MRVTWRAGPIRIETDTDFNGLPAITLNEGTIAIFEADLFPLIAALQEAAAEFGWTQRGDTPPVARRPRRRRHGRE
jgi:hypothetical protein